MADMPLHRLPDADLERTLRLFTDEIDWPVTTSGPAGADLASSVRARIEAAPRSAPAAGPRSSRRWTWRPARLALVVAVIVLLALAALAGAAALGLPGLRIILGDAPVSPPPSLEPRRSPAPGAPGSTLGLGRRVDVADLGATAAFPVGLPTDPALGPPDAAYIDDGRGGQVTLVWASRPGLPDTLEPGVGLVLMALDGTVDDGFISKIVKVTTSVQLVLVNDKRAYWLSGDPHFFFYEGPNGFVEDPRRWVGDVLLWADGPVTYRLETSLPRERAIEIAESVP